MDYEEKHSAIKKALEKLIEMEYITPTKFVTLDAIVAEIVDKIKEGEAEVIKKKELQSAFSIMEKYYPGSVRKILENK